MLFGRDGVVDDDGKEILYQKVLKGWGQFEKLFIKTFRSIKIDVSKSLKKI